MQKIENQQRVAQGKEALPTTDIYQANKLPNEPSRLSCLLIQNQLDQYVSQLEGFVKIEAAKMEVAKGVFVTKKQRNGLFCYKNKELNLVDYYDV